MSTAREKTATMAGGARELPKWQPQQILCQSRKIFGMILALANIVPKEFYRFGMKLYLKNPKILLADTDMICIMQVQEKERVNDALDGFQLENGCDRYGLC